MATMAKLAIPFYLASLFRDLIYDRFRFFPLLFNFGPPGAGKSFMAWSFGAMYGMAQNPFMLPAGTSVGFFRHFGKARNGMAWFDEFGPSIDLRRVEHLKNAYDGAGGQKGTLKSRETISDPILSACNITGQTMPSEAALLKRCVLLKFGKTKFSDEAVKNADKLKKIEGTGQLSSITAQLSAHRATVKAEFNLAYDKISSTLKNELKGNLTIEDRILNNTAILVAVYSIIAKLEKLPYSLEEVLEFAANQIRWQCGAISTSDESAVFWSIFENMIEDKDCQINEDRDFLIQDVEKMTIIKAGQSKPEKVVFTEKKKVLFLRMNNVYPEYSIRHLRGYQKKGLPDQSLRHYLTENEAYIGYIKGKKFNGKTKACLAFYYDLLPIKDSIEDDEDMQVEGYNIINQQNPECSCGKPLDCQCDLPF